MSGEQYESQKYTASMFAIRKAITQLQEHFEHVRIECEYTDSRNVEISCAQEWTDDADEPDDEQTKV